MGEIRSANGADPGDRQSLTSAQIEARRIPPTEEECLTARRSEAVEPMLCRRYGIPRSVAEEAERASGPYGYSAHTFYKLILEYLYPPGTRVTLLEPLSVEKEPRVVPGSEGTTTGFDDQPSMSVAWDNGSRLSLLMDVDKFSCEPAS